MILDLKLSVLIFTLAFVAGIDTLELPLPPKNIHMFQKTNFTYPLDDFPNAFHIELKKAEMGVALHEPHCHVSPFRLHGKLLKTHSLLYEVDSAVFLQSRLFLMDQKDSKIDIFGVSVSNDEIETLGSIDFKSVSSGENFYLVAYQNSLLMVSKTKLIWYNPEFQNGNPSPKHTKITQENVLDGHFNISSLACAYVTQNRLYLCAEDKGLKIYNLTNSPKNPRITFQSEITRAPAENTNLIVKDIAFSSDGRKIYLLDKEQGVYTFHITNRNEILLQDTIKISGAFKIVQNDRATVILSKENGETYLSEYFKGMKNTKITHVFNRKVKVLPKTQNLWIQNQYVYLASKNETSYYLLGIPEDSAKGANVRDYYKNLELKGSMLALRGDYTFANGGGELRFLSLVSEKATLFCDASNSRNGTFAFNIAALQFNCKSQISKPNQPNMPSCLSKQKLIITVEPPGKSPVPRNIMPKNIIPIAIGAAIAVVAIALCICCLCCRRSNLPTIKSKKDFSKVKTEENEINDEDSENTATNELEMAKL